MKQETVDALSEVADIVLDTVGVEIRNTSPDTYIVAILKALEKLKENQCDCLTQQP